MPDSSSSLLSRYQSLKEKQSSLERSLLAKEAEYNTLHSQYSSLLKETLSLYNVSSLEELSALLSKEESSLQSLLSQAEALLAPLSPSSSLDIPILS